MIDPRRRAFLRGDVRRAAAPAASIAERLCASVDSRCLASRGVECRLCGDACEPGAIRFVPALGGIAALRLDAAACDGCGACAPTCPVGAIVMQPRAGGDARG